MIQQLKENIYITTLSPHNTLFDNGVEVVGCSQKVVDDSSLKEVSEVLGVKNGVELVKFELDFKDSFVDYLEDILQEITVFNFNSDDSLFILCPAILSSVDKPKWDKITAWIKDLMEHNNIQNPIIFVSYIATNETKRAKPQDKVARSDKFSLLYHI